jgi:hypothetical protein
LLRLVFFLFELKICVLLPLVPLGHYGAVPGGGFDDCCTGHQIPFRYSTPPA